MFIMSENLRTDYTYQLEKAKQSLDEFFCIPLKEEANDIVEKMKKRNTKINSSSLGELDEELVKILRNDKTYFSENRKVSSDGEIVAKSLFEKSYEDAKLEENKKPYEKRKTVSMYADIERNATTIAKYAEYVSNLKSIKELDKLFLEKLNVKCTEYKSSTDYMSRLVRRLIKYNFPNDEIFKENDTTRVLILKQFIKQFDWFKDIKKFDLKDVQALVKEKYKGKYELIDDDIFIDCNNQNASWGGWQITEGFIDAIAKMQGIIKYKAPFIKMNPKICEMIKCIIIEDKLIDESKLNETKVLSECFKDFYYDVELDWFKTPEEMGMTEELVNVLCRVVKPERLTQLAKKGKAKTLSACFKGGRISPRANVFKNFNEIEMIPELCRVFYKMLRKGTNEEELRSQKAKDGTARTLAECFTIDSSNMQINNINSIITCFYKLIYDEMDKAVENCTVNKSTYNDATKKGGDLYEKSRKKLNFYYYELLKIVDDLANAKFSNQGKTREYLYVFAIAFDMTSIGYSEDSIVVDEITGDEKLKEDPRKITDIQKNLFFDYYADNIVNNLDSFAGINKNKSKMSVDGYGINYKNFAEVAFLWSINQSKSAADKLKTAYSIINYFKDYCKKNKRTTGDIEQEIHDKHIVYVTDRYKDKFSEFLGFKEDEVKEFLVKNYSYIENKSETNVKAKAETGKFICETYIKKIREHYKDVATALLDENILEGQETSLLIDLFLLGSGGLYSFENQKGMLEFYKKRHYLRKYKCRDCKKKKIGCFPECGVFNDECDQWYWDYHGELTDEERDTLETTVIDELNKEAENVERRFLESFYLLSNQCTGEQEKIKSVLENVENSIKSALSIVTGTKEIKDVSRELILSLCYIDCVLLNWHKRLFDKYRATPEFSKFFKNFCRGREFGYNVKFNDGGKTKRIPKIIKFEGADYYLGESNYQIVNSKNLFDISLIFMAFRDNYKQLFQYAGDEFTSVYLETIEYEEKMKKEIEINRINENNISKDR